MSSNDSAGQTVPSTADLPLWLKIGVATIGIIMSLTSTYAAVQSKANGLALETLKQQEQSNIDFDKEIANSQQYFTSQKTAVEAMIASLRLYTLADTVPKKLAIVEIAKDSNQSLALVALAPLVQDDEAIINPNPGDGGAAAVIKDVFRQLQNAVRKADALQNAVSKQGAKNRDGPSTTDPPLTESANQQISSNARVLAALPQQIGSGGYVFLGDSLRSESSGTFENGTAVTTAVAAPRPGEQIVTCTYVNLRETPFANGQLGALVTVLPAGTMLEVLGQKKFSGTGAVSHKPIFAWWGQVKVVQDNMGVAACPQRQ